MGRSEGNGTGRKAGGQPPRRRRPVAADAQPWGAGLCLTRGMRALDYSDFHSTVRDPAQLRGELRVLEHIRNERGLFECIERWLFLRKKPLECEFSVYGNSENAIARERSF